MAAPRNRHRLSEKDFHILLSFLSDKDPSTVEVVKRQIRGAVRKNPGLAMAVDTVKDPVIMRRAQELLQEFHHEALEADFMRLFRRGPTIDLEKGLTLLARVEYPELKEEQISKPLDALALEVDRVMASQPALPTRPINAMRHILFEKHGFRGNDRNYYEPENTYFNKVLERKTGIPISLSCLYLFVGWRLNLLVHGVGLPGHFIVGHRVPRGVVLIDAFEGGRTLRKKDCESRVKRLGLPFKEEYLDPVNNLQILARMVINLINIYTDQRFYLRAQWLARLFRLIS